MSFFHKMKKTVLTHKESSVMSQPLCPEYDALKLEFDSLHDAYLRLQTEILTFKDGFGRTFNSASSLATDLGDTLLMEASRESNAHPYAGMASSMRTSHAALKNEREKLDSLVAACLVPLRDQFANIESMRARLTQHEAMRSELVYYQGKVFELKKARDSATKPPSAADNEKYERNVKKEMNSMAAFRALDASIVADLRLLIQHRVAVLGPTLLGFYTAEKQIVTAYLGVLNATTLVDMAQAESWLNQHQENQKQQNNQRQHQIDPLNNPVPSQSNPAAPIIASTASSSVPSSAATSPLVSPTAANASTSAAPFSAAPATATDAAHSSTLASSSNGTYHPPPASALPNEPGHYEPNPFEAEAAKSSIPAAASSSSLPPGTTSEGTTTTASTAAPLIGGTDGTHHVHTPGEETVDLSDPFGEGR